MELLSLIRSEGYIFGLLLFLMTVALASLVVLLALTLRRGRSIPPRFVREVTEQAGRREFGQLVERSRAERSFLGQVVAAGMGRLGYGLDEARRAAAQTAASLEASLRRPLNYLALVGILSPLVGLAGTLLGVALLLLAVARANEPVSAAAVAAGVGHSLVVTLHGVVLSLVAVFFYFVFKDRLRRVTTSANLIADNLLARAYHEPR
jgi:biopolymer transport protein ExbB